MYSIGDCSRINRILALTKLGVSLSEVHEIVEAEAPVDALLARRESELRQSIAGQQARRAKVRDYLVRVKPGETMNTGVESKALREVIVASLRTHLRAGVGARVRAGSRR